MRITMLLLSLSMVGGCYKTSLFNDDGTGGYFCHLNPDGTPEDHACPDGTACIAGVGGAGAGEGRCVKPGQGLGIVDMAGGRIPKMGTYTGTHVDPMLNAITDCTDSTLEPNDTTLEAVKAPDAMPDTTTPKITKMAICPKGNRPDTGAHDEDYFKLDTTKYGTTSLTMMAELFYDITYGDLDIGIFDSSGRLMASDGTAVGNACAAATVTPGVYYVLVVGAGDLDVNRYDVRIRTFSGAKTCATGDMGM